MAYFDNAATTYPKPATVYDFMDKFYIYNYWIEIFGRKYY